MIWVAWRLTNSSKLKLGASIAGCALTGLTALFFGGAGGVSYAHIQSALVIGALFLAPRRFWQLTVAMGLGVALVVGLDITHAITIQRTNPTDVWEWILLLFAAAPAIAAVLMSEHAVIENLDTENRQLEEASSLLYQETEERRRAQQSLEAANLNLERVVADRVSNLETIRQQFEFFSEVSLRWLRKPLVAMIGSIEGLVANTAELAPEVAGVTGRMQLRSRSMLRTIEGLKALGGIGSRKLRVEKTDLSLIATRILTELQETAPGRQISTTVEPDLIFEVDRVLAESALRNLLENAWKFTADEHAEITVRRTELEGVPAICVADNGKGFDAAAAERIFEPFERLDSSTEVAGSGIGLATVRQVVMRHDGSIKVDSTAGEGARFTLTFGSNRIAGSCDESALHQAPMPIEKTKLLPEADWKVDSLQLVLIIYFGALLLTIIPLTITPSKSIYSMSIVIGLWLCAAPFPFLIFGKRIPYQIRAVFALLPLIFVSGIGWSHTADCSGVTLNLICAMVFSLLFFGRTWLAAMGLIQFGLMLFGAYMMLSGKTQPGILPADPVIYWQGRLPVLILTTAAMIVVLKRSEGRIRACLSRGNEIAAELRTEIEHRKAAEAAAASLNERLDAIVQARTRDLEIAVDSLRSFTGLVSHDLRGPVRGLIGLSSVIKEDFPHELSKKTLQHVSQVDLEIHTLADSVEELIDLVRELRREGSPESLDLSSLVHWAAQRVAVGEKVRVPDSLRIRGDRRQAQLAVQYLVQDATHANEMSLGLERTDEQSAVYALGCSTEFLDAVQTFGEQTTAANGEEAVPLEPIAFMQLCRRQGGRAWVERGPNGARKLLFTLT